MWITYYDLDVVWVEVELEEILQFNIECPNFGPVHNFTSCPTPIEFIVVVYQMQKKT